MPILNVPINQISQQLRDGKIKIAVFGLGRIGLPTALIFADRGAIVYGYDTQDSVIESIKSGNPLIDEPGLPELLTRVISNNHLIVTTNIKGIMENADVFIICVPTPITKDKVADYSQIIRVCEEALHLIKKDDLIIVESTISPATIDDYIIPIIKKRTKLVASRDFDIVCCPERADPGNILSNFQKIPRIIGGLTEKSAKITEAIYKFVTEAEIIIVKDAKTASAVKLTENIFRDVNIALMNELAILYEKLGLDIIEIIEAASTKYNFQPHYPGAGVGGPCLPANPYYLIQEAIKVGFVPHLIRMAREINDRMPQHIIELTLQALNEAGKSTKNAKITILGVTYKPHVRDFQLSPAIPIINGMKSLGAEISIYDPLIQPENDSKSVLFQKTKIINSIPNAIEESDCLIFVTAHDEFKNLKFEEFNEKSKKSLIIVDGRNIFDPAKLSKKIIYKGVGRKKLL